MTQPEIVVVESKPKRPQRRTRPAPEPKPSTTTLSNGTPDRLAEMERGDWDARIAQRARPADDKPAKWHLDYNFPLAWVRRPDGDIVQLQSDPNNRAMYEDLGFVFLSQREVKEWLEFEQPRRLALQREKAGIISALRMYQARTPGFVLEFDMPHAEEAFSDMSIERLYEVHAEIEQEIGHKIRLPKPKAEPKAHQEHDAHLNGIETGGVDQRIADLMNGTRSGNGRSIELRPGQPRTFV